MDTIESLLFNKIRLLPHCRQNTVIVTSRDISLIANVSHGFIQYAPLISKRSLLHLRFLEIAHNFKHPLLQCAKLNHGTTAQQPPGQSMTHCSDPTPLSLAATLS